MKLPAISIAIAIALAGLAGVAAAAQPGGASAAAAPGITGCEPPNDHTGNACEEFNRLVRSNFTPREIGMLFGSSTSYPESRTGGLARLQRRYQALIQEYVARQNAPRPEVAQE